MLKSINLRHIKYYRLFRFFGNETILLCSKIEDYKNNRNYTHVDIDASLLLGIMSNQVVFPEHNPYP